MYREREEKVVRESTCEGKRERIATIRLEKVFVKNQLKEFFPLVCKGPALKAALRGTKKVLIQMKTLMQFFCKQV